MFFTRYQENRLRELESKVASLSATIESLQQWGDSLLQMTQAQHKTLADLERLYSEGLARARAAQAEAEQAIQNPPWSSEPLHVTEDEEDLQWQADNNIITEAQLQDMLKEHGLNPSIERF